MAEVKCPDLEHDYRKFDDASVVCRKCGDQRVVDVQKLLERLPPVTYLPCPGPHYPVQPYAPYVITYTTGTADVPFIRPENTSGGVYD